MNEQRINEENWDLCIVLDDCRYDIFKEEYSEYLEGYLEKRISPASNTGEWLQKVFTGDYDYTYISANPYINSKQLSLKECTGWYTSNWTATDHFDEIIDAWMIGWDKDLGTVPPDKLSQLYLNTDTINPVILHYVQPHTPYLCLGKDGVWRGVRRKMGEENNDSTRLINSLRDLIGKFVHNYFTEEQIWLVRKHLNLEPISAMESIWREGGGREGVMDMYRDNLRRALESVAKLINTIDTDNKRVVITADHGEAFGDKDVWGHPGNTRIPELIEVPWMEVTGSRIDGRITIDKEQETHGDSEVQDKLKDLGYL